MTKGVQRSNSWHGISSPEAVEFEPAQKSMSKNRSIDFNIEQKLNIVKGKITDLEQSLSNKEVKYLPPRDTDPRSQNAEQVGLGFFFIIFFNIRNCTKR